MKDILNKARNIANHVVDALAENAQKRYEYYRARGEDKFFLF
jgi:hypothetical protein